MDYKTNLAALIKVKTIVTFVVIAVFAYLAIDGRISSENVMIVTATIIAFFFAKKSDDPIGTEIKTQTTETKTSGGGE